MLDVICCCLYKCSVNQEGRKEVGVVLPASRRSRAACWPPVWLCVRLCCVDAGSGSWTQPQPVGLFALNAASLSFSPISTWKAVSGRSRFEPLGLSPSPDWIPHNLFSWCGFPHVVFILFDGAFKQIDPQMFFHTFFDGMFPMYFFHKLP